MKKSLHFWTDLKIFRAPRNSCGHGPRSPDRDNFRRESTAGSWTASSLHMAHHLCPNALDTARLDTTKRHRAFFGPFSYTMFQLRSAGFGWFLRIKNFRSMFTKVGFGSNILKTEVVPRLDVSQLTAGCFFRLQTCTALCAPKPRWEAGWSGAKVLSAEPGQRR